MNVAQFFAAFLLTLAILELLFAHPWGQLKIWSEAIFGSKDWQILIGHGALNEEIAGYLTDRGVPLTILADLRSVG